MKSLKGIMLISMLSLAFTAMAQGSFDDDIYAPAKTQKQEVKTTTVRPHPLRIRPWT